MKFRSLTLGLVLGLFCACGTQAQVGTNKVKAPKAIQLFNGKDMKNWTPKIRLHEVGENYANTFRVEEGLLKVRYDGYSDFNQQYGHLAYNKPFSYYILKG